MKISEYIKITKIVNPSQTKISSMWEVCLAQNFIFKEGFVFHSHESDRHFKIFIMYIK